MNKTILCILLLRLLIFHASAQNKPLHFAFLTDVHVSPHTPSEQNLADMVQEINAGHYDFVVVTGDLTNVGSDSELTTVHRILSELRPPQYVIPGNHETNWSESACQTFLKYWKDDRFFFERGKYLFIGFDTGPYMKMGDGHVKAEDIRWINRTLQQHYKAGLSVISLSHYPLTEGLDNWYEVTDVLKKYHTVLSLCGHGHRLSKYNFDGIPGLMGRAALTGNTAQPGYNIVILQNDSIYLYEKLLGEAVAAPFAAFSLTRPSLVEEIPSSPRPDFSVNNRYAGIKPVFDLQDTASVFTGVLSISPDTFLYGNSTGEMIAVSAKSKKPVWTKHFNGSIYSTPVYGNGIIAFGTIDGFIHGLDARTGREKWSLQADAPVVSEGIVEGDDLYIGAGDHDFYKINIRTGKIIWSNHDMQGLLQGKPALADHEVLFGAWDRHLYCLDKDNGQLKWKWDDGRPQKLYSPGNVVPAVANGKVFIVAPDRYMTAIDLRTGQQVWRTNEYQVRESMCLSEDGHAVYAKLMNDTVIAVSTEGDSFQLLWKVNAGFGYEHNPCPLLESKGTVYAGTKNGLLIAIDASSHKVKWEHKAGNSSINKISTDGSGNIWISLIEGKIQAYNPPLQTTYNN